MKTRFLWCIFLTAAISAYAVSVPLSDITARANNKPLPSIFQAWGALIDSADILDEYQRAAKHDLVMQAPAFYKLVWNAVDGYKGLATSLSEASITAGLQVRSRLLSLNPNIILIGEIRYYDAQLSYLPSNSTFWMRNDDGSIKINPYVSGGYYLLNPNDPDFQTHVGMQAKALLESGVVDGIFLDWAKDSRLGLIARVREIVGEDAVIMGNVNSTVTPGITPLMNAVFMECGPSWSPPSFWEDVRQTIISNYANLRQPKIICTEIWPDAAAPGTPLNKLSEMRAGTTLSLTHSEGYFMYYPDGDLTGHSHTIYPFWKCDVGKPIADRTLYNGAWVREYQNATIVYNPKGNSPVTLSFEKPVMSQATGQWVTMATVADYDGDIFIKASASNTPINLAKGKTITFSSQMAGLKAANAVDSNNTTRWCATTGSTGEWLTVDLGNTNYLLSSAEIMWENNAAYKYKIEGSADNITWSILVDKTSNTTTAQTNVDNFSASGKRYIRMTYTGSSFGWASCYEFRIIGTSNSIPTYTLIPIASNGSISLNPPGGTYAAGTVVTVTATPNSGYMFSNWSGAISGSTNPTTITMNANKGITANFVPIAYTITPSAINGSITLDPAGGTYTPGTVVTVTATPNSGYTFSSWSGALSGSTNPTTIIVDANKSITATFAPITYTITPIATNGSIILNPAGGTYTAGTVVTVTATPNSGYTFSSWSGALSGSINPTTIIVDANKSITANFTPITYTITPSATNGAITLNPAGGTYAAGTVVTVTATPNSGYTFSSWAGSLSGSTNPTTITMNANKSITANFAVVVSNLVQNGDFSNGVSFWTLTAIAPCAATGSIVSGEFFTHITAANTTNWHIKLYQNNLALEQNKSYTLKFNARAQRPRTITVEVKNNLGSSIYQTKTLSTAMQTFTITFTHSKATARNFELLFFLSNAGLNDVWIDNVRLTKN